MKAVPIYPKANRYKLLHDNPGTPIEFILNNSMSKDDAEEIAMRYNQHEQLKEIIDMLIGDMKQEALDKMLELGLVK